MNSFLRRTLPALLLVAALLLPLTACGEESAVTAPPQQTQVQAEQSSGPSAAERAASAPEVSVETPAENTAKPAEKKEPRKVEVRAVEANTLAAGPAAARGNQDLVVSVGDSFRFTELATTVNGDNGLTFYYTSDGATLTPFTSRVAEEDKWWTGGRGCLVMPRVIPQDNYGVAGSSDTQYVVMGYQVPASGTVDLFSWTALQGPEGQSFGYHVKLAQGSVANVIGSYDCIGDTQTVANTTVSVKVQKGEMLYVIYEPVAWEISKWYGYITSVTYRALGDDAAEGGAADAAPAREPIVPELDVKTGDVFKFTQLATDVNGDNGLTFYYTSDGKTLKPITNRVAEDDKWWHGGKGVLVYPSVIPEDNYGVAGSSDTEYVVMGYQLPATGHISLFSWMAIQGDHGDHGYRVRVAYDEPDNFIGSYECIGDTQTVRAKSFSLAVEKGKMLYIHYEPTVWKISEWFGYITQVRYQLVGKLSQVTARPLPPIEDPEITVNAGDTFAFSRLATDRNGENRLTFYYTSDGTSLTPFTQRVAGEDKWWTGGRGCLVMPRVNLEDNYGIAGSSDTQYVAIGYKIPQKGVVDLFSWTALQGPVGQDFGYRVKLAKGTPENIVGSYDCKGDTQTIAQSTVRVAVEKDEMLYILYEPFEPREISKWYGWKASVTYVSVGDDRVDPISPSFTEEELKNGFWFTELAGPINGDNGVTYGYTTDGAVMTPFTEYDHAGKNWFHGADGLLVRPVENAGDFYAQAGTSEREAVVMCYEAPADGKIDLRNWTALHSGDAYKIKIALRSMSNVVRSYQATGAVDAITDKSFTLNVEEGERVYLIYQALTPRNGAWFGTKTRVSYAAFGLQRDPIVPEVEVRTGDEFWLTDLVAKANNDPSAYPGGYVNGDNGLTYYHGAGDDVVEFSEFDETERCFKDSASGLLVCPVANEQNKYGYGGMSATETLTMCYELPAEGKIRLYNWTVLHSGDTYNVTISLDTPTAQAVAYTVSGDAGTEFSKNVELNVAKGQKLYISYQTSSGNDTAWFGYKTSVRYLALGPQLPEPTIPEVTVENGYNVWFTDLAGDVNGDNGLKWLYTADGTTLAPFTEYDSATGRWWRDGDKLFAAPTVNINDKYAQLSTSDTEYVAAEYLAPATGEISVFSWTATHENVGYNVSLAVGTPSNVLDSYLSTVGGTTITEHTFEKVAVRKGQKVYLIYQQSADEKQDGALLGCKAKITYTWVGEPVTVGQELLFSNLAVQNKNGSNGLTFYHTPDGMSLTPFSLFDPNNNLGTWYAVDADGKVVSTAPWMNVADNYGICTSSQLQNVVIGYQLPSSGTISLYNWMASHSGGQFKLTVSKGTLSDIVKEYTFEDPQADTIAELAVTRGEMLYFRYVPLTPADGAYCGYQTKITYTAVS